MPIELPSSEGRPSDGGRWEFTAREPDPEAALRYHDPAPVRWTMEDPVGCAAGEAHLYRYAGDGPTEAEDGPGPSPS